MASKATLKLCCSLYNNVGQTARRTSLQTRRRSSLLRDENSLTSKISSVTTKLPVKRTKRTSLTAATEGVPMMNMEHVKTMKNIWQASQPLLLKTSRNCPMMVQQMLPTMTAALPNVHAMISMSWSRMIPSVPKQARLLWTIYELNQWTRECCDAPCKPSLGVGSSFFPAKY